jgi:hypothetical protein
LIADIRDNELDVLGQHPSRCSRLPFTRLSTTRTSKPPAATSRTNSEPMNPAPPVIRTRCLDNRITPRRRLEKSESRFYQLHQCGRMPERWREISRYYRVRGSLSGSSDRCGPGAHGATLWHSCSKSLSRSVDSWRANDSGYAIGSPEPSSTGPRKVNGSQF